MRVRRGVWLPGTRSVPQQRAGLWVEKIGQLSGDTEKLASCFEGRYGWCHPVGDMLPRWGNAGYVLLGGGGHPTALVLP